MEAKNKKNPSVIASKTVVDKKNVIILPITTP